MNRFIIMASMFLGSLLGGYLPTIWGGSFFSMSSILLSALGGSAGIWIGYKITLKI